MGVSTAYATVQNPDGSIHYFTYSGSAPWPTSAWQGSDNNTVYNGVDYGMADGGSASDNTAALASLFTAMGPATPPALGGGSGWIPQYNFPVNTALALNAPVGAIFQGLGTGGSASHGGVPAFHFSISDVGAVAASTFITTNGAHTSGGHFSRTSPSSG
jgi:hypothetical protein